MNSRVFRMVKCLLVCSLLSATALAYDSEWPPEADPYNNSMSPGAGLQMGKISIVIPSEFSQWFGHQHDVGWGVFPMWFALGDVEGRDNGDLDIVMYFSCEILLAGRLNINWANDTGTMTPLWCWKVPNENPHATPPSGSHAGPGERNCLIWDFDGDGANEVALVAPKEYMQWGSPAWGEGLYILRTNPRPGAGPWDFSVPPPEVLCSNSDTDLGDANDFKARVGICKVRDTAYPMDIASHDHDGKSLSIWKMNNNSGVYSLTREYSVPYHVPITHEFNYADVDDDGYDEFMLDGVLDFVDKVGGVATPTNGLAGVQRWSTGHVPYDHTDQMICADWDPSLPGLEIHSAPEGSYTDRHGAARLGKNILWSTDGTVIRQNTANPFSHPQSINGGNFTNSRPGFESIHVPKSFSYATVRGGETWLAGSYAIDANQNLLAVDGGYWQTVKKSGNEPGHRASGPAYEMGQIDWDGDRSEDEIINYFWQTLIIWRMGEKGDWLPGAPPAGMPDQTEVTQSWTENYGGTDYTLWWDFYQGYNGGHTGDWGWNNGGAGRHTHYYEKLGEAFPGSGSWVYKSFDVGKDYREEAVVAIANRVNIFYNTDSLADPTLYPSPRSDLEYRKHSLEMINYPFDYSSLPTGGSGGTDTDGDGLSDDDETNIYSTDPNDADSDDDGLNDGAEVLTYNTDPNKADSDGDRLPDGWEISYRLDPNDDGSIDRNNGANGDPDGDGFTNGEEYSHGTDPRNGESHSELFTVSAGHWSMILLLLLSLALTGVALRRRVQ
ncbi:hypothetical protein ACFL1X_10515 [Candidatus Hydrogenedentota bacterium]